MIVLSHRGQWQSIPEKNTMEAFNASFVSGFGTETDFRDWNGRLVISHDPPLTNALEANRLFELLYQVDSSLPLAINIKADGLQALISEALLRYPIENYFLFDMAIPDAMAYLDIGLRIFTRQSDVEPEPVLYREAYGLWLDAFMDDKWITEKVIANHLDAGKRVCLVSPELHRRPYQAFWDRIRGWKCLTSPDLMICTDNPVQARNFFNHG